MAYNNTMPGAASGATRRWRSQEQPTIRDRDESWHEVLGSSHLPWTIGKPLAPDFRAELNFRAFGPYRLAQCRCTRIDGYRSLSELAGTDEAYITLLYLQEGGERLTSDGGDIELQAGDLVLWDSTRRMRFSVPDHVSKVSLLIPEPTFVNHLPQVHNYIGAVLRHDTGMSALLGAHMRALGAQLDQLSDVQLSSVMDATLELLSTALRSEYGADRSIGQATLNRIREYVISRLDDPELSPSAIARAFGISLRHLYSLFERQGSSVAAWIRTQRLERARHELMHASLSGKSVTEIALDWGYTDLSHFSKAFKQTYGQAPRHFMRDQGG